MFDSMHGWVDFFWEEAFMNSRFCSLLIKAVAGLLVAAAVISCRGSKSGRGFHLPEGDVDRGRVAFVQLGCNQCHPVAGVELPASTVPEVIQVKLGGEVLRVKTYGQLVTSIINPSHITSPQYLAKNKGPGAIPMPDYADKMTVKQMIDVVAFLHSRYTKVYPNYTDYAYPYEPSGVPVMPHPSQYP